MEKKFSDINIDNQKIPSVLYPSFKFTALESVYIRSTFTTIQLHPHFYHSSPSQWIDTEESSSDGCFKFVAKIMVFAYISSEYLEIKKNIMLTLFLTVKILI